ncbi:type VI secretion system-associated protein TagF [Ramlibacter sp. MMS24-I3-19]|uniref:type VI secretion system-associated protein TagF n=1 Tax=Ramlibacter sp. MMS24-I3-19 TaxID=3416606 RepID=UPI003CFD549C
MSALDMVKLPRRIGWWGKLPARGDFVGRGLPPRWRAQWDGWLQQGLALAASTIDGDALRERLAGFAPWRYLALPSQGEAWCGIVVPSHDRVGRAFPLTLAERVIAPVSLAACAARLALLLDAAAEGPEALEEAIAALPAHAIADDASTPAWPAPPASAWTPLSAADDSDALVAGWPPSPALLFELLGLAQPAGL